MFSWIFGNKKKTIESKAIEDKPKELERLDTILDCAKFIIENGELKHDDSSSRTVPEVIFKDSKGNTLYITWYYGSNKARTLEMNGRNIPKDYDREIFSMAEKRIKILQKKYLEETIKSVKR